MNFDILLCVLQGLFICTLVDVAADTNKNCYKAKTCVHNNNEKCGVNGKGIPRRFLDICDIHEFNCLKGTDFIKTPMAKCSHLKSLYSISNLNWVPSEEVNNNNQTVNDNNSMDPDEVNDNNQELDNNDPGASNEQNQENYNTLIPSNPDEVNLNHQEYDNHPYEVNEHNQDVDNENPDAVNENNEQIDSENPDAVNENNQQVDSTLLNHDSGNEGNNLAGGKVETLQLVTSYTPGKL